MDCGHNEHRKSGSNRLIRFCHNRAVPQLSVNIKTKNNDLFEQVVVFWRRRRDLNPRAGFPAYSLSRGAPSASWVLLQVEWIAWHNSVLHLRMAERVGFEPTETCASPVFKTGAFNRSATSPCLNPHIAPKRRIYFTTNQSACQPTTLFFSRNFFHFLINSLLLFTFNYGIISKLTSGCGEVWYRA